MNVKHRATALTLLASAAFVPFALLACRSAPSEPAPSPTAENRGPSAPDVHVISAKDHRTTTKVSVGDFVELPHDAAYEWSIKFEHDSFFEPAPASDAGVERYRAARTGTVRCKVEGEPKVCMHTDAACTLARYSWAVTLWVQ
jgi:hypothetical protein